MSEGSEYIIPRFLYHGTSARAVGSILAKGLRPRGRSVGNWKHTVQAANNRVYLTDAYPLYFAAQAAEDDGGAVIEVDTQSPAFRLDKLITDEDFLEQATRQRIVEGTPEGFEEWTMKNRTIWFRDRAEHFSNASASLKYLGTCAYLGIIPVAAITRVATIEYIKLAKLFAQFDPLICLLNYQICGERYRQVPSWLFDGKSIIDNLDGRELTPDREGINIRVIQEVAR